MTLINVTESFRLSYPSLNRADSCPALNISHFLHIDIKEARIAAFLYSFRCWSVGFDIRPELIPIYGFFYYAEAAVGLRNCLSSCDFWTLKSMMQNKTLFYLARGRRMSPQRDSDVGTLAIGTTIWRRTCQMTRAVWNCTSVTLQFTALWGYWSLCPSEGIEL
jgi:hypothetical protein